MYIFATKVSRGVEWASRNEKHGGTIIKTIPIINFGR